MVFKHPYHMTDEELKEEFPDVTPEELKKEISNCDNLTKRLNELRERYRNNGN